MRKLLIAAFAALCVTGRPAAAIDAQVSLGIVSNAINERIAPVYSDFRSSAAWLLDDMKELCAEPSVDGLESALRRFSSAVEAWSRAEIVRFGPVSEKNRLERLLYWPDRKSIGLKQVQAILASKDPKATNLGTLVQKSVALQGFGALEFVLFGTGSDALAGGDAFRCAYGKTVAFNIERRASELDAAWHTYEGFPKLWSEPGPDNPLYRDAEESLTEIINTLVHGLEMVRDVRINGFLGATADDDKARQAIFWRSENTINSIQDNLESLKELFLESNLRAALPENSDWIAQSITFEFANADGALMTLQGPIAEILADPERRAKLDYVRLVTSSLSELIGKRLSAELGLTAGFSSLDGD